MTDKAPQKISEFAILNEPAVDDVLPIVDVTASETKGVQVRSLQLAPDGQASDPGLKFKSGGGFFKSIQGTVKPSGHFAAPLSAGGYTSAVQLTADDAGRMFVLKTADIGVKVSAGSLNPGDAVVLINNVNGTNTITAEGSSVVLRLAGNSDTGNVEMKAYASCTLVCVEANTYWAFGIEIESK